LRVLSFSDWSTACAQKRNEAGASWRAKAGTVIEYVLPEVSPWISRPPPPSSLAVGRPARPPAAGRAVGDSAALKSEEVAEDQRLDRVLGVFGRGEVERNRLPVRAHRDAPADSELREDRADLAPRAAQLEPDGPA
jgi:hypothetical protein